MKGAGWGDGDVRKREGGVASYKRCRAACTRTPPGLRRPPPLQAPCAGTRRALASCAPSRAHLHGGQQLGDALPKGDDLGEKQVGLIPGEDERREEGSRQRAGAGGQRQVKGGAGAGTASLLPGPSLSSTHAWSAGLPLTPGTSWLLCTLPRTRRPPWLRPPPQTGRPEGTGGKQREGKRGRVRECE